MEIQLATEQMQNSPVSMAAFSTDGKRLITVQGSSTITIWTLPSGQPIRSLNPSSPFVGQEYGPFKKFALYVESVALNSDGTLAIIGLNDNSASVYDIDNGNEVLRLKPTNNPSYFSVYQPVRSVVFSADGELVAVGFSRHAIGVWNLKTKQQIAEFECPFGEHHFGALERVITSLAFSADSRYIFAGCVDMTAAIWDTVGNDYELFSGEHAESIACFVATETGILWATNQGAVWEITETGRPSKVLDADERWRRVVLSQDGKQALVLTYKTIKLWDLSEGGYKNLAMLDRLGRGWSTTSAIMGFGRTGTTYFFPHKPDGLTISVHDKSVSTELDSDLLNVEVAPNGNTVAVITRKGNLHLGTLRAADKLKRIELQARAKAIAFSEDSSLLAISLVGKDRGAFVEIWNINTLQVQCRTERAENAIDSVCFVSNDELVCATRKQTIEYWQLGVNGATLVNSLKRTKQLNPKQIACAQNKRILTFLWNQIEVWDEALRAKLGIIPTRTFSIVYEISNNQILFSDARSMQTLSVWDLDDFGFVRSYQADIERPEVLLSEDTVYEMRAVKNALVWSTTQDKYLHTGGVFPRGWITPMRLSNHFETVVLTQSGASLFSLLDKSRKDYPCSGRISASVVTATEIMLLNDEGKIFVYQK